MVERLHNNMNIWFAPTNSSHLDKNITLLRVLQSHGHQVRIACVDEVQDPIDHSLDKIRNSGFAFEMVHAPGFPPGVRLLWGLIHSGKLKRGLRAFLQSHKPIDAVVFGADTMIVPRTFVRAAVQQGIPTVLIVDGLVLPNLRRAPRGLLDACRRAKSFVAGHVAWLVLRAGLRGTSGVDLILTVSKSCAKLLAARCPHQRVRPVGSPEYDDLAMRVKREDPSAVARRVRDRLGLDDRPVVFFAHQPLGLPKAEELRRVAHMAEGARRGGGVLLVKFHPRGEEYPAEWQKLAESIGLTTKDVRFIRDECTSIECCLLCGICVTIFSTVALEAMICGKPLVAIHYGATPSTLPYGQEYGAAYDVHSGRQLEKAIAEILTDEGTRRRLVEAIGPVLDNELFGLDGRGTERMESEIMELVRERSGDAHKQARSSGSGPVD